MLGRIGQFQKVLAKRRYRYTAVTSLVVVSSVALLYATCVPSVAAQSSARCLPELAPASAGQKVLVFTPHPDDETIAAGGYIAQSIRNGADVRIVLVTDGDKYHKKITRYSEFRTATGMLGVKDDSLFFLGYPDGKLASEDQAVLQASLLSQIEPYHPDIVIFPHPRDTHPDHAALGKAVKAITDADRTITRYEYLVHYELVYPRPRKFDAHLYLLPPLRLVGYDKEWLRVPLSQEVEDLKQKALLSYDSQFHSLELNGLMHSFIRRNELLAAPQ